MPIRLVVKVIGISGARPWVYRSTMWSCIAMNW
jgi:hypothetical protein